MAVFSAFLSSVAHFCCSSTRSRKPTTGKNKLGLKAKLRSRSQINLSSKALLKMISRRKVHEKDEPFDGYCDDYDDEAIWRRTIIMGEKCRPLDFSGKIVYDSHGNLLP